MTEDEFFLIAQALVEPSRVAIMNLLKTREGPFACKEICARLPLTQATVSHHMKELSAAGLVLSSRMGREALYQTNHIYVEAYLRGLREMIMPKTTHARAQARKLMQITEQQLADRKRVKKVRRPSNL